MLNEGAVVEEAVLDVVGGLNFPGGLNTEHEKLLDNIRYSIRQGYPQVRQDPIKADRVILVGGGPSLESTFGELRDLLWEGGSYLVTLNGAYHWALSKNLKPNCQIVVDAQPHNSRFVEPEVPGCRYLLASQCARETWDAVRGRPHVWIFHAAAGKDDIIRPTLDEYYNKQWFGMSGGTTVFTRGLSVLRCLGYIRFELFGIDSCWGSGEMEGQHHAYPQEENSNDRRVKIKMGPEGHPELERVFTCSPWHCQQAKDFIQMVRVNGDHYLVNAHGDGLIAHILKSGADAALREIEAGEAGAGAGATNNEETKGKE